MSDCYLLASSWPYCLLPAVFLNACAIHELLKVFCINKKCFGQEMPKLKPFPHPPPPRFLNFYIFIKLLQFTTCRQCVLIILNSNPSLTPPRFLSTPFPFIFSVVWFPSSHHCRLHLVSFLLGNVTWDSLQRISGHRNPVPGYELQKQPPWNVSHDQTLLGSRTLKM